MLFESTIADTDPGMLFESTIADTESRDAVREYYCRY